MREDADGLRKKTVDRTVVAARCKRKRMPLYNSERSRWEMRWRQPLALLSAHAVEAC
jgi:hypothetical protein